MNEETRERQLRNVTSDNVNRSPVTDETPKTPKTPKLSGMFGFSVIWIGQLLSLLGTAMTGFAMPIWAYETTGEVTTFTLLAFFAFAPIVLLSPIAGAIVDRYDRKRIMILADLAAGIPTVAVLLLYNAGLLQVWHLFVTGMVSGSFQAFHFPAYSAAVTMMVPKRHYARASGMLAAAQFAAIILSPIMAALLMDLEGITTVLLVDICTFLFAIGLLMLVHIQKPPPTDAGRKGMGSLWKESLYGFSYIRERPSLLGLQLIFFSVNLIGTFGNVLMQPMLLTRIGGDKVFVVASVLLIGGIGGVLGSIALTVWGGPKRRVNGILFGLILESVFGMIVFGLGRQFYVWAFALFVALFTLPIINGSSQSIWQAKVAPDVQGRVFATRLMIAQISVPIAMLLAGPLADLVFEPGMISNGALATMFGPLVGNVPGSGMSLMFVLTGIAGIAVGLIGYSIRQIRNAEDILPDHEPGASEKAAEGHAE